MNNADGQDGGKQLAQLTEKQFTNAEMKNECKSI